LAYEGFEQSNAARMSAAGEGSTEPNLYFRKAKMQTNPSHSFSENHRAQEERSLLCEEFEPAHLKKPPLCSRLRAPRPQWEHKAMASNDLPESGSGNIIAVAFDR
jgi:hypothetical protein